METIKIKVQTKRGVIGTWAESMPRNKALKAVVALKAKRLFRRVWIELRCA